MKLPRPRAVYDPQDEAQARAAIEQADAQNVKRGQDVELAGGAVLILTDTVTGVRVKVTVASGAVVVTPA
jgi:hypothetical protein